MNTKNILEAKRIDEVIEKEVKDALPDIEEIMWNVITAVIVEYVKHNRLEYLEHKA